MSITEGTRVRPAAVTAAAAGPVASGLAGLVRGGTALAQLTPNWFAAVMGTGIVANAAAVLPVGAGIHDVIRPVAIAVWLLATALLITLAAATAGHWRWHRAAARAAIDHPVMGQFTGAAPMAVLTVGAGTVAFGSPLLGSTAAVAVGGALWLIGTLAGLATCVLVPLRTMLRPDESRGTPVPAWLMPVVPPMVSASTAAALVPHLPAGQLRLTLLLTGYALFGMTLVVGLLTVGLVYARLMGRGVLGTVGAAAAVPTVWITLGMIGQSATAAVLLGARADGVLPNGMAAGAHAFGLLYGLVILGFGAFVFALAVGVTVHTARTALPFSMTWWAFTFPVGTCVTGAAALAGTTGATALAALADALYVGLVGALLLVVARTAHGVATGRLLGAV
ncbi:SLAC1 family transporter [Nakamurella leprariae]|uniref:C4-dicarboxylate ABC transporter n=1 Tax=Nakamurella leprariae TaxID=2803911 RepID=A0A939C021_9ACTN|nr:C4-dicarboxylate ABC transporter [Nakamurella leprariae]MBM9468311.1 C4-dicarboxylate ABC transporter [Nakamurella leprariae]